MIISFKDSFIVLQSSPWTEQKKIKRRACSSFLLGSSTYGRRPTLTRPSLMVPKLRHNTYSSAARLLHLHRAVVLCCKVFLSECGHVLSDGHLLSLCVSDELQPRNGPDKIKMVKLHTCPHLSPSAEPGRKLESHMWNNCASVAVCEREKLCFFFGNKVHLNLDLCETNQSVCDVSQAEDLRQ